VLHVRRTGIHRAPDPGDGRIAMQIHEAARLVAVGGGHLPCQPGRVLVHVVGRRGRCVAGQSQRRARCGGTLGERRRERQSTGHGAGEPLPGERRGRHGGAQSCVVGTGATKVQMQVQVGIHPRRRGEQVGLEREHGAVGSHLHGAERAVRVRVGTYHLRRVEHPDPRGMRRGGQRARARGAQVDDGGHRHAGLVPRQRRAIRIVVCGEQHAALRRQCPLLQVVASGAGQHDPGTVVVGEYQRALQRAGGQHDGPCAHLPEPLFRPRTARRRGEGASHALGQPHAVLVERHDSGGAGEHRDVGRGAQFVFGCRQPRLGGGAIDTARLAPQRAAHH
jgi:hypothetical protein